MAQKRYAKNFICILECRRRTNQEQQTEAAKEEAERALSAYWNALEGTIDPNKVSKAAIMR